MSDSLTQDKLNCAVRKGDFTVLHHRSGVIEDKPTTVGLHCPTILQWTEDTVHAVICEKNHNFKGTVCTSSTLHSPAMQCWGLHRCSLPLSTKCCVCGVAGTPHARCTDKISWLHGGERGVITCCACYTLPSPVPCIHIPFRSSAIVAMSSAFWQWSVALSKQPSSRFETCKRNIARSNLH